MRIRQSFVGADAHIGPLESCEFAIYFHKKGAFCRGDVGIDPYGREQGVRLCIERRGAGSRVYTWGQAMPPYMVNMGR